MERRDFVKKGLFGGLAGLLAGRLAMPRGPHAPLPDTPEEAVEAPEEHEESLRDIEQRLTGFAEEITKNSRGQDHPIDWDSDRNWIHPHPDIGADGGFLVPEKYQEAIWAELNSKEPIHGSTISFPVGHAPKKAWISPEMSFTSSDHMTMDFRFFTTDATDGTA